MIEDTLEWTWTEDENHQRADRHVSCIATCWTATRRSHWSIWIEVLQCRTVNPHNLIASITAYFPWNPIKQYFHVFSNHKMLILTVTWQMIFQWQVVPGAGHAASLSGGRFGRGPTQGLRVGKRGQGRAKLRGEASGCDQKEVNKKVNKNRLVKLLVVCFWFIFLYFCFLASPFVG